MPVSTKGIYALLIHLDRANDIQVGKRRFHLENGFYGYVGSALAGLEHRLARHLRSEKKFHWHIDYLINVASVIEVIYGETAESKECDLSGILSSKLSAVRGFGCSDCKCPSHLFYCSDYNDLINITLNAFKSLELYPLPLVGYTQARSTLL